MALLVLLAGFGGMIMGMLIMAAGDDKRKTRRKHLKRAEDAMHNIDNILFKYLTQVDIVGHTMMEEIRGEMNFYKRGKK